MESTILDVTDEARPRLLRPGAIPASAVEAVIGRRLTRPRRGAVAAPGRLPWHYSPRAPLVLVSPRALQRAASSARPGDVVLLPVPQAAAAATPAIAVLAPDRRATTAARNLYAILRRLDRTAPRRILTSLFPGGDEAEAVNDRLRKAAARRMFPIAKG